MKTRSEFRGGALRSDRDRLHRQMDPNDARRHNERLIARRADRFARVFRHFARVKESDFSRTRVRAAGIGRDGDKTAPRRALAVVDDGRAAVEILRIDSGGGRRTLRDDERKI